MPKRYFKEFCVKQAQRSSTLVCLLSSHVLNMLIATILFGKMLMFEVETLPFNGKWFSYSFIIKYENVSLGSLYHNEGIGNSYWAYFVIFVTRRTKSKQKSSTTTQGY